MRWRIGLVTALLLVAAPLARAVVVRPSASGAQPAAPSPDPGAIAPERHGEAPQPAGGALGSPSAGRKTDRHRPAHSGEAKEEATPTPSAVVASRPPAPSVGPVPGATPAAVPVPDTKPAPAVPTQAAATPADLVDRISRARASLDDRLESSVAMYQAAARQ